MATKSVEKRLVAQKAQRQAAKQAPAAHVGPLKLDLGCGINKQAGFYGLDAMTFDAVDAKVDLGQPFWDLSNQYRPLGLQLEKRKRPDGVVVQALPDACVDEAHCSHFIEHLTWPQRVNFFNELYRVMKPGATCRMSFPHWASMRYYGDPTHKEPMSEFAFNYLLEEWRKTQAPHCGYTCNFHWTGGYAVHPEMVNKAQDAQMFALKWYKEAATDIVGVLTKPAA